MHSVSGCFKKWCVQWKHYHSSQSIWVIPRDCLVDLLLNDSIPYIWPRAIQEQLDATISRNDPNGEPVCRLTLSSFSKPWNSVIYAKKRLFLWQPQRSMVLGSPFHSTIKLIPKKTIQRVLAQESSCLNGPCKHTCTAQSVFSASSVKGNILSWNSSQYASSHREECFINMGSY